MKSACTVKVLPMVETLCLRLYLGFLLEIASYGGAHAYRFIEATGHLFRSREFFASTFERGVLRKAQNNLQKHGIADRDHVEPLIETYLKFESRFVLENIWIRRNLAFRIIDAFNCIDLKMVNTLLHKRNFIIATPHTPALYMLVALISKLGHDASFVVMNPFFNVGKEITPLQRSILKLFELWPANQKFIFMEHGEVFDRCATSLKSGRSIIIAPDTPSDASNKVAVDFMQYKTMVAPGVALLSKRYQIPIMVIAPWSQNVQAQFRLNIKIINPEKIKDNIDAIESIMNRIFNTFESTIRLNPAFWHGWLYWHHMEHQSK